MAIMCAALHRGSPQTSKNGYEQHQAHIAGMTFDILAALKDGDSYGTQAAIA
ncbi:hypothetical protein [Undibacterium oligocarboniphilum]|uniref:Uncharacterized protein n=1 Tax=Undibacterium oligocarboniphilum TaxID=666702 RepID=A0A850QSC5_9BURK|nr:hypothetical protein [Undibacterium oligocarboniphilum]MBC3871478.1 hypothetical protein [Undibacterium oligocarboniphilum]NVO78946.1 hypothetical protein [Undibacterium oligocarboniphilum]